jgi:hypothetical protein
MRRRADGHLHQRRHPQSHGRGRRWRHIVSLGARDPLLDAMAFSRGAAVEVAGLPALVLPADPAISRVVEDCRKPG